MAVDWTQLPHDILQSISKKITVYSDYVRFRAVCPLWRSFVPRAPRHLPPQLPWLMLPLSQSQPQSHRSFYDLSTGKTYHLELPEASSPKLRIGSSNGWLVIFDESPAILLLNPLTRAKLDLPPLFSFPNVVSFDLTEVGKEYAIRGLFDKIYRRSLREMRDLFIKKIVLSSGPENNDNNINALAILGRSGELAYYKNGDESWTFLPRDWHSWCDVAYYKEQFYVVDEDGAIAVCDLQLASVSIIFIPPTRYRDCHLVYLVVSGHDELLLVVRHLYHDSGRRPDSYLMKTWRFDVFRMNWSGLRWDRLENLGGRLLFIGEYSSVLVSTSIVRGCPRNPCLLSCFGDYGLCLNDSIYFTDDRLFPSRARDPHSLWFIPRPF